MLPTAESETDQRCFWELVDAIKEIRYRALGI